MLRLLGSRATIVLQQAPTKVKPYASGQFPIQSVNSADWRSFFSSSSRRLADNDEKSPEWEEMKKFLQSQVNSETELNVPNQLKKLREAFEEYKVKGDPEYNRYLKAFFEAEALSEKGSLATPEELISSTPKDLLKTLRREVPTDLIFDKEMSGDNEVLGKEMLDFIQSRVDSEFREAEKAALDETQQIAQDEELFTKTLQEMTPPPREVVPEFDDRLHEGEKLYEHQSTRPRYAAKQSRDLKERFNKTTRDINKPAPSLKEVLDAVEPSVARALYGKQVEAESVPGMDEKLYGFNFKEAKFKYYTDKPTPPSGQPTSSEQKLPNPASFGREDEDRIIQQNVGQPAVEKLELHTKLAGFVSTHEHRKQLQQDHVDMITTLRKDKIAQGQIREPNFRVQDSTNRTHEVNPTSALAKNWNAPKYVPAKKAANSLAGNQSDNSVFYNRTDEPVSAEEVASRLTPQPFAMHRPALDAQDMFVALPLTEWDQDLMRGKTNQLNNNNSPEENERLGQELLQGKQNVEGNYSIYQERTTGEGTKFPDFLSSSGFGFSNPYFPDLGTMPDTEAANRRGKTGAQDLARSARRVVEVFDKRTVQSLKYFRDYPGEAKKWVRVMLQPAGLWNDDGEWEPWGRFHEFFNKEAVDNLFSQQPESSAVHRYARDHKLGQFAQFDDLKSVDETKSDESQTTEELGSEEEYRKQLTVKVSGIEESFRTTKLPVLKEMTAPDRLVRLPRDLVGKYRFGLKEEHVQNLSSHAQRLLSFQYAKAQEAVTHRIHDSIVEFGKHQLDTGHPAVQVATMSERIRGMEEHLKKFRKDNNTKVSKAKLESRRKKMLRYLKNYDIHKYFEVINKYHIVDDIRI